MIPRGENMIKTHSMIMDELSEYGNPKTKLARMVSEGRYIPVIRGLYETDPCTAGYLLAGSIYGPSYLSFEFALSYYGLIPETVHTYTSATFDKKKKRSYDTPFGSFSYRDVPAAVYPIGVVLKTEGEYTFQIATKEKAICDKLYTMSPISNQKEMKSILEDNLRIDMDEIIKLDEEELRAITQIYHSTNVSLFFRVYERCRKLHRDCRNSRT